MPVTPLAAASRTSCSAPSRAEPSYQFGRCYVLTRRRQLLVDGEAVDLDGVAFDLLVAVIARRGRLLAKADILKLLWPSQTKSECCLWILVSRLRAALHEDGRHLRSVPGQGYVFTADVAVVAAAERRPQKAPPASTSNAASAVRSAAEPMPFRAPARDAAPLTVVVIDDDDGVREAVGGLLRSVGLHVEAYTSIAHFSRDAVAGAGCLLLDVKLPKENGLDFFERIAGSDHCAVPVIFMTAHADIAMSVRAMKSGALDFLTKPVRADDLLHAVQCAFESARSIDAARPARRPPQPIGAAAAISTRSGLAPWQERRAKELLLADLAQEVSLARVAEDCAMSRSYFSQAFKRSTGLPPHRWLSLQRVIKAKELMLTGTPIADAALACGFSDQSHFTRVFARSVGMPPGTWLRRQRCEAAE